MAQSPVRVGGRGLLACAGLALAAGLIYVNALHNPFVYDDHRTILGNSSILSLTNVRALVLHDASRPVVNLSYAIDRRLWGPAPFGFHLTNVLLHVLNVALLFLIAWHVATDRGAARGAFLTAFTTAALFAVHPMMTEAVGYVSARPDVLCATCCLLAVLSARRWMLGGPWAWWGLTVTLWVAALFTKEFAVAVPALLWCYDRWILGGDAAALRRRWSHLHAPLFTATCLAAAVRMAVFVALEHPEGLTRGWLLVPAELVVMGRYVRFLLAPFGQTIYHDVASFHVSSPRSIAGLSALAVLAAIVAWRRTTPIVRFGVAWFLLLLAPASALALARAAGSMAEHRAYFASAGLFLVAGVGVAWLERQPVLARRPLRWLAATAGLALLFSLSAQTVLRNTIWGSPIELWEEAVSRSPALAFPHVVLGESLHDAGLHERAAAEFRTGLRLGYDDDLLYLKLGLCLSEIGRFGDANTVFEALGKLRPNSPVVTTGQGMVAWISGDAVTARQKLQDTLARNPRDVVSRQWLAVVEEASGHPAEALHLCREIQQLTPDDPRAGECVRRNESRADDR